VQSEAALNKQYQREGLRKSDKPEEMVKAAKQAKAIVEKHRAEFLRMSRFHTGTWAGEWLIVTRYASWEVYGKAQEAVQRTRHSQSWWHIYSYLCPTNGPQHLRRRRSYKVIFAKPAGQPAGFSCRVPLYRPSIPHGN
jgi:hypothetical protein